MNWISVKDKLPELQKDYLIYNNDSDEVIWAVYDFDWLICRECRDYMPRSWVTHYAELPSKPVKESE